ncbi:MAG TPA: hypothetical protein VMR62_25095 [Bryobacteraceae bacterium]|nr:hypothetical protein [Bryobacteraceae bacterium]
MDKTLGLGSFQRRHGFQKFIQRKSGCEVINQHLHGDSGPPKTGRSRHSVLVYPNHFLKALKEIRLHKSKLQQADETCKFQDRRTVTLSHPAWQQL